MADPDLLKGLVEPALMGVRALISAATIPKPVQAALTTLVNTSGLIVVAGVCGALGRFELRLRGQPIVRTAAILSAVVAAALCVWIIGHPSDSFDALFARWDHLAFAGSAGLAITILDGARRKWWLTALSGGVVLQYAGWRAVSIAVALSAGGVLLFGTPLRLHRRAMFAAQAALIVAAYGVTFGLRHSGFAEAAGIQALLAFWLLRHISLVAAVARTGPPSVVDCAAFLSFYPGVMGLFGAPEIYDEFARRNLRRAPVLHHQRAAQRIIEGVALVTVSMLIPVSVETIEGASSAPEAWAYAIAFFVRTALAVMGAWRTVDGIAWLYGMQLRANFSGLLGCRNPSELWWSWRGTLTNWLVQFVYAPLGGARRPLISITAAFAVSFGWHALGAPFMSPDFQWVNLLPIGLWAAINGAAVLGHITLSRPLGELTRPSIPVWLRVAVATLLTWALGSLTPILLHYHGRSVEHLWTVLGNLTGLR